MRVYVIETPIDRGFPKAWRMIVEKIWVGNGPLIFNTAIQKSLAPNRRVALLFSLVLILRASYLQENQGSSSKTIEFELLVKARSC